jgi:hypothetical protein
MQIVRRQGQRVMVDVSEIDERAQR